MSERDTNDMNIQQIVAAVVSNLHSLPSPRASFNGSSSSRFRTAEDEIQSAFSLPRVGGATSNSNDLDENPGNAPGPSNLSLGYSHLRNYSMDQGRNRRRKGKQPARSTSTGRFEKGAANGSTRGQGKSLAEPTFKDVCLLPSPDWCTVPRLKAKAELIGKGLYVDAWSFQKTSDESQLREEIGYLFRERLVDNHGDEVRFEFVRSVGTDLLPITLQKGQEICGRVIKHITGNGPIYVRACNELACLSDKEPVDGNGDDSLDQDLLNSYLVSTRKSPSPKRSRVEHRTDVRGQLQALFPNADENSITEAVSTTSNLHDAIDSLLPESNEVPFVNVHDEDEEQAENKPVTFCYGDSWSNMSIPLKMGHLKSVNVTGRLCKLQVDEDDILNDAVAFYKSPSFDPTRPLRVSFYGQPAIDTGGVLREFFSTVKEKFINAEMFSIFEGPHERLLFRYDQSSLAAGIPQILGKLVAQSLIHGCGGFQYLSPSHYYYIATGDTTRAAAYASVFDVYDTEKRDMLDKLMSAKKNEDLQDLNQSEIFLSVIQDSGLKCLANIDNTTGIIEAIVSYHVLVKRAVMLDSFAKGLEILGVLAEIRRDPCQFEAAFLHSKDAVHASAVMEKIIFMSDDPEMYAMLASFVNNANRRELECLLKFVTGIGILPLTNISVNVDAESTSVFASTCLMRLHLPVMLKSLDQETFNCSMCAAIRQEGKAFTSC